MNTEIEAKWLHIDHDKMRELLLSVGADCVHPSRLMKRKNFDFPDGRLQAQSAWIRLRDEGEKVTLAYKQLENRTITGTKEVSVEVNSFDQTCMLLEAMGMKTNSYQETRRESWRIGDVEIELDCWPWIDPFIEIEASTEQQLRRTAELLGLDMNTALHGSVEVAYQAEYDVTEEEVDNWPEITFCDVPDWLASKKRT